MVALRIVNIKRIVGIINAFPGSNDLKVICVFCTRKSYFGVCYLYFGYSENLAHKNSSHSLNSSSTGKVPIRKQLRCTSIQFNKNTTAIPNAKRDRSFIYLTDATRLSGFHLALFANFTPHIHLFPHQPPHHTSHRIRVGASVDSELAHMSAFVGVAEKMVRFQMR